MDYISDKNHMHMNGTIWTTLTTFVKYLERTNQVTTDKDAYHAAYDDYMCQWGGLAHARATAPGTCSRPCGRPLPPDDYMCQWIHVLTN